MRTSQSEWNCTICGETNTRDEELYTEHFVSEHQPSVETARVGVEIDGVLARLNDAHPDKNPAEIVTDALLLYEATDNADDALAHGRAIGEVPGDG